MSVATPIPSTDAPIKKPRLRLEFLDGMRGLAALYVVLFHAVYTARSITFAAKQNVTPALWLLFRLAGYGHFAVDIFIVLSGYCLMIPVMRSAEQTVGQFFEYIKRRARRIIPPYYAALVFSLLCIFAAGHIGQLRGNELKEVLSPGILGSHLLLLHNLKLDWVYRINAPMWSVATEWQIYFLFPLILLPVWKKLGSVAAVVIGLSIGLLPFYLLPKTNNFWWVSPWFPGLFAMGMAAAGFNFSAQKTPSSMRRIVTSGWTPTCLFLSVIALQESHLQAELWVFDVLIGIATASLIAYCAAFATGERKAESSPWITRLFESRWAVRLGAFSYSLYLTHNPLQTGLLKVAQKHLGSLGGVIAFQLLIGVPVLVAFAYGFHLLFERPFMSSNKNKRVVSITAHSASESVTS